MKKITYVTLIIIALFMVSCSSETEGQTFAEAHDAFETKLVKQTNDKHSIPEPPESVFELEYFDSKVGELAAYVSSNPGDSQKHPLIIWVAGGWGNDIDEFAWSYPEWDNDQTASAFREAGILMMYPSFRGANGNPGYYETLFGEVDDIVSAYEYAASLSYVDPDRIYLGGHSTGGTKVLLASEYTDKFRAVFSLGPVDNVKYHNPTQFTFDTSNKEEYKMRSPIWWLEDIKSPTFIIEGVYGNSKRLGKIKRKSRNENIYCYVVDDADHFSILAPITRLVAQKILEDTGAESNIAFTEEELVNAMNQPPIKSYPVMVPYNNDQVGFSMKIPAIWEKYSKSDEYIQLYFTSEYEDDNFWDMSMLYVDVYEIEKEITYDDFLQSYESIGLEEDVYQVSERDVNGQNIYIAESMVKDSGGSQFFKKVAAFQKDDIYIEFSFYILEEYWEDANIIFENVIESILLK